MENIYFALTEAFNREAPTVALASGQAVVFYRIAIMSKDGDWVIRETPDACERVLRELETRGARYRPGAPLDVRWLAGGWSSHFEFFDEKRRRIRCDFVSRPPRVPFASLERLFNRAAEGRLIAIDPESLILMKRTQRAKDYAVIAELAALLPPEHEIDLTTDPDRMLALTSAGFSSNRPAVLAARSGAGRRAVVTALAEETDMLQQQDGARLAAYDAAAQPYLAECRALELSELPLREAHARLCEVAERRLPPVIRWSTTDADAQ
ncbi:MAG: hypothetical protein HYY76_12410 [Acidobacteria bacterium]|nr:hypothetical protein [Acidobacteriota bacterium]